MADNDAAVTELRRKVEELTRKVAGFDEMKSSFDRLKEKVRIWEDAAGEGRDSLEDKIRLVAKLDSRMKDMESKPKQ